MSFTVYENNKQCDVNHQPAHPSWDNSTFPTFAEAVIYAKKWLGQFEDAIPDNWDGSPLDYCYGNLIEIRQEDI